jgi:hypothetical protein
MKNKYGEKYLNGISHIIFSPDEETVSEFENLIRKEWCRYVLENNFSVGIQEIGCEDGKYENRIN